MTAASALAAETLKLERTLSDLADQAYGLTRTESVELVICSFLVRSKASVNR